VSRVPIASTLKSGSLDASVASPVSARRIIRTQLNDGTTIPGEDRHAPILGQRSSIQKGGFWPRVTACTSSATVKRFILVRKSVVGIAEAGC
jgi:hypothetical protein